jgi:hypothetical protein
MFYNARFYDSQLGRFTSADTIIPGAGNSSAYDRYAYTLNNPLKYTDPTGHRNCEEDGYHCYGDNDPETDAYKIINKIHNPVARTLAKTAAWYYFTAWKIDAWLYENVPTAVGIQIPAVTGSIGPVTGEISGTYIYNWRSNELDEYATAEGGATLSFPPDKGASGNVVLFTVKGASTNSNWEGYYVSGAVQAYLPIGVMAGESYSLKEHPIAAVEQSGNLVDALSVDPASGMNVVTNFAGVGIGLPGASGSLTFGSTFLNNSIFDLNLPIPLIPPNNPYIR